MRRLPLAVLLVAVPAMAASKFHVAAPRCVLVTDHQVYPLKGARIEGGTLRCDVKVTVPKDVQPQTAARLALRQDGKELAKIEVKAGLSAGTAELELQLEAPEALNGCMPYELVTRVGDAEAVQKAIPSCPD
jgi:hypothetical protein